MKNFKTVDVIACTYLVIGSIAIIVFLLKALGLSNEQIIDLIPASMSALAAGLSLKVAQEALKNTKRKDECYITVKKNSKLSDKKVIQVSIKNSGPGLAILESGRYILGSLSAEFSNPEEVDKILDAISFEILGLSPVRILVGPETAIAPNEEIELIEWEGDVKPTKELDRKIQKILHSLRVEVCYRDINGNKKRNY